MLRCLSIVLVLGCVGASFAQTLTYEVNEVTSGVASDQFSFDIALSSLGNGTLWTTAGVYLQTYDGATFVYAADPNGDVLYLAPDRDGPPLLDSERLVTFVSRPRAQEAPRRFRAAGAPEIAGPYLGGAGLPQTAPDEFDVAFFTNPNDLEQDPGYLVRCQLNLGNYDNGSPVLDFYAKLGADPNAPGDVLVASGFFMATTDVDAQPTLNEQPISVFVRVDCNNNGVADSAEFVDCNGNGILDSCDIATGRSEDCDLDGVPDECEPDCNDNGIPDSCESGADCDGDGVPDACETDCDLNGTPDDCDILNCPPGDVSCTDCNGDGVLDACQISDPVPFLATMGPSSVPNAFVFADLPDNRGGVSLIVDGNGDLGTMSRSYLIRVNGEEIARVFREGGSCVDLQTTLPLSAADFRRYRSSGAVTVEVIPNIRVGDVCGDNTATITFAYNVESDCDEDGQFDSCVPAPDCDNNGICDRKDIALCDGDPACSDCDGDGVPDACQIANCPPGDLQCRDCNENGIPDGCETLADCDSNGVPDRCEIADCPPGDPTCTDCDGNQVPDGCEVITCGPDDASCLDCNGNGIPNACEYDLVEAYMLESPNLLDLPSLSWTIGNVPYANAQVRVVASFSGVSGGGGILFNGQSFSSPFPVSCTATEEFDLVDQSLFNEQLSQIELALSGSWSACEEGAEIRLRLEYDRNRYNSASGCDGDLFPEACEIETCPPGDISCLDCDANGFSDGCELSTCPPGDPDCDDCNGNLVPDICETRARRTTLYSPNLVVADPLDTTFAGVAVLDNFARLELRGYACDPLDVLIGGAYAGTVFNEGCRFYLDDLYLDPNFVNTAVVAGDLTVTLTGSDSGRDVDVRLIFEVPPLGQDCNGNRVPDDCDIASGTSTDVNGNTIPDDCETDCNGNGIPDAFEIASGLPDCDENGIPDECEQDCDGNGINDVCDLRDCPPGDVGCRDCNANGLLDRCETSDCDGNGVPDECDIAACPPGQLDCADCDGDGNLDTCQPEDDCDGDGVLDACAIAACPPEATDCRDCNGNGLPDGCEMDTCPPGTAACGDCDGNRILDACELPPREIERGRRTVVRFGFRDESSPVGDLDLDISAKLPFGSHAVRVRLNFVTIAEVFNDGNLDCERRRVRILIPAEEWLPLWSDNGYEILDVSAIRTTPGGVLACPDNDIFVRCTTRIRFSDDDGDCDNDGQFDFCERLTCGASDIGCRDCDQDGVIDSCQTSDPNQVSTDCNLNGIPDACEITYCPEGDIGCRDCNNNGLPDSCDIANCDGSADCADCNANQIPDICEVSGPSELLSGVLLPIELNQTTTVRLRDVPDTTQPVRVEVEGFGSFASPDQWFDVSVGSTFIARVFTDETARDCLRSFAVLPVDPAVIRAETTDGAVDINIAPSPSLDLTTCDDNLLRVALRIEPSTGDCNLNGIPDSCDLLAGTSLDANGNGTPDECDPDCNGNGIPDDLDLAGGASDINGNSVPDECDPDCNNNGLPDDYDVLQGGANDCNGDLIPDQCDTACDCRADLDSSGDIDLSDLAVILANFGEPSVPAAQGDVDGDGDVDLSDLAILLQGFGCCCTE